MRISPLIDHLKTGLPTVFHDRIAAVFNYRQKVLEDVGRLPLPALYIELGALTGEPVYPEKQTYEQYLDQHIFLFLELDNTTDPRGQLAQDRVDDFQNALFPLLVNYPYVAKAHQLEFVSSEGIYMDRARYIHQFEFRVISRLTALDGYVGIYPDLTRVTGGWELQHSDPVDFPNAESNIPDLDA